MKITVPILSYSTELQNTARGRGQIRCRHAEVPIPPLDSLPHQSRQELREYVPRLGERSHLSFRTSCSHLWSNLYWYYLVSFRNLFPTRTFELMTVTTQGNFCTSHLRRILSSSHMSSRTQYPKVASRTCNSCERQYSTFFT